MARRPRTTTTTTEGTAETPAPELTPRQIARRATLDLANSIVDYVGITGYVALYDSNTGNVFHIPLSSLSESLASAVAKIKKEKADAEAAARAELSLLLQTDEGKKIAAELLAEQSPIDPRD